MKPYLTEGEYKKLLESLVILSTTNEQKNQHILSQLDKLGFAHEDRALKTGDYCFYLKANKWFPVDTYFVDELAIERKNSVDELASCMKDIAFHNEVRRLGKIKNAYILVEDNSLNDIIEGNYRAQYNSKAFFRTLLTWCSEYNVKLLFVNKENMGKVISEICLSVLNQQIFRLNKV